MPAVSRVRKVICAVFLIASLAIGVLWVYSYRRHEVLIYAGERRSASVAATYGRVALRHVRFRSDDASVRFGDPGFVHNAARAQPTRLGMYASDCSIFWVIGPFSFIVGQQSAGDWKTPGSARWTMHLQELVVPYWFILMLTLAPAAWMIYRTKPTRPGHCTKCGYDLRASPDRCPECGAVT
jgi:hypothetical protein